MSSENTPIPPAPKRMGRALLVVGAAAVLVALIVALVVWRGGVDAPAASGSTARPTASTPAPPIMLEPATPVATAPADSRIPADCEQIYTTDWAATLGPLLVLNPEWTKDSAINDSRASNDSGLVTQLEATSRLTCNWAKFSGAGGVGLITQVAALTAEQQLELTAYIGGLGYICYDELDGLRCVTEATGAGETWGESHFIRDGIWLATRWINVSPDGYTHDMVNTIFGTA